MSTIIKAAAAGALFALSLCVAHADDSVPDNTVRVGMYYIHYQASAGDISGPYVPTGLNLSVNDVETLYLAYVRRLSEHFDLELAAGWPPLTKTEGRGPDTVGSVPYNGQVISTARWFAPTVLLNYKFFDDSHAWRPYVGVGLNYVYFYDRRSTGAGDAIAGGPTSVSLPVSVGVAGTVGMSYHIKGPWSVFLSYSGTVVKSKLTTNTAGIERTTDIEFAPRALVFAGGYAF
jgi:outer membrane protein